MDFLGGFQNIAVFRAFPEASSCQEVQGLKVITNQQTPETCGCANIFKTESGTTCLVLISLKILPPSEEDQTLPNPSPSSNRLRGFLLVIYKRQNVSLFLFLMWQLYHLINGLSHECKMSNKQKKSERLENSLFLGKRGPDFTP